jgi:PAS domain S-box-containing protein
MRKAKPSELVQERPVSDDGAVPVPAPSDWMFLQPAILDQMHDSIVTTDLHGMINGCNRAATQIYGYTSQEMIGKSIEMLYPEEDRPLLLPTMIPSVVQNGEFRGEVRTRTRSGDTVYVHLSISLLRDSDGEPAGMVAFSVNVTAQKLGDIAVKRTGEVERELEAAKEQADLMRLLVTAVVKAEDVFLITEAEPVDHPGPRILYVNDAFEKMTGYTREEVLGQTPRILQGPKTDRAALDRIKAALKQWQPVREEMTNYHKDGTEFTVDLSIVPIADENGWYTHWMAIQRDTTEQTRVRQQLAEDEARLHFLTEAMPQLLWTASPEGSCQFVSQACAYFMGTPTKDVLGAGWLQFIHPDDSERTGKVWAEALQTGQTFVTEYRLRRRDGEYIWFLHRAVPRRGETGKIMEWIGSSTDIEQQKRSEDAIRQTEKLAAVGRLASSIAHEINNPLTSVTNLLYLLSNQTSLSRVAKEYVKSAQEELARVSEITTQTLRFHKQSTSAVPTRISEVLDNVLAFYRPRFVAAQVQVLREYKKIEQITCFAGDIRQAFANLIGNALEASQPGGRLRLRLRPSLSWRYRVRVGVRVTIADTGTGMDADVMRRAFEPFYTTKGITGTGLGLWITKDLIAKHDGIISMRSSTRTGQSGTVISVFLPFEVRGPR